MGTHMQAHSQTPMYLHTWLGPEAYLIIVTEPAFTEHLPCISTGLTFLCSLFH